MLTDLQRSVMAKAIKAAFVGNWYRAESSGERVTLASLWRTHGLLERRAWRGAEGEPDAAYEYRPHETVMEEARKMLASKREPMPDGE
ncbi:MAG TPA: hypothetical protein VM869_19395 [Enhygromyxa sp.]|jgi:hypothetical protein|nr:hypothetical protein [Enhygromyxa sp.]